MKSKILQQDIRPTKSSPTNFTNPIRNLSIFNGVKGLIFLVKVEGESAWPELIPEKIYFATNLLRLKIGDFVVFRNPKDQREILVKRIKFIRKRFYFLEGTLPWSESSKNFGLVDKGLILGKIISI